MSDIDKSSWPPGPWHSEPDLVEFESAGLQCLILRHPDMGHLCGYVAIPSGHPWFGVVDSDDYGIEQLPECHGGVTYSRQRHPDTGEASASWWVGFDASHYRDTSPTLGELGGKESSYRTVEYMRLNCELLAQAARMAGA